MFRRIVVAAALVGVTTPAAGQELRQFQIGPRVGLITYDTDTGLKDAAMLGLDAVFNFTRNIGIGFRFDIARPETDGKFFPAEMTFGDTTLIFAVTQPVTVLQYGGKVELTTGGSLALFASGGVGGYRITLDPQVARGQRDVTNLGWSIGGGVSFQTTSGTRVRLEIHDFIFQDYRRADLDPVQPTFQGFPSQRFPDVVPPQSPFEGTAHNIHFAVAFAFTPGGGQ